MRLFRAGKGRFLVGGYLLLWAIPFLALFISFFSFTGFFDTIFSSRVLSILGYTFMQAAVSTAVSFVIAILPAYYAGKHQNIVSGFLNSTVFIPFFFPAVSAIVAFSLVFSSNGLLSKAGLHPDVMYSLKGVVIAHVFYNAPLFVRYIGAALRGIPREIIEEASASGASPMTRFLRIEWPLVSAAAGRAALLVFVYSFMSFVIVLSIGGVDYYTIEAEISSVMRSTLDFPYALSLAMLQFLLIGAVAAVLSRDARYELSGVSAPEKGTSVWSLLFSIGFMLFEYSFVLLGIAACFYDFYSMKPDVGSLKSILLSSADTGTSVIGSIGNSIIVSTAVSIAAVMAAFTLAKQRVGRLKLLLVATVGISSAFLSVGLLYTQIISGVSAVLLFGFGCILNAVPVAYMFMSPHVEAFDRQLIDAARISGAGPVMIFRKIEFPLLLTVFMSAFFQVWMITFGEFTIAYTMQIQDSLPLASITAFALQSSHHMREGAALSGLMICIVLLLCALNSLLLRRMDHRERKSG